MKRTTDNRITLGAIAIVVVVVNAITLGGAWYNRTGEPTARLQLTEREVALPYPQHDSDDDSGLALRLKWHVDQRSVIAAGESLAYNYYRQTDWLDADKLRALGFAVPPATDTAQERRGGEPLPRDAWLLLEFDGESHQRVVREAEQRVAQLQGTAGGDSASSIIDAKERLQRLRDINSRLYVIDADLDAEALRERHRDPARQFVVRGRIGVGSVSGSDGDLLRHVGLVEAIAIDTIQVPKAWRTLFDGLSTPPRCCDRSAPRYTVTLAWGRRFEPWLESAAPLP